MLISDRSTESFTRRHAGGKGLNLFYLSRQGFLVPRWLVLGSEHFAAFQRASDLGERIQAAIGEVVKTRDFFGVSASIRDWILGQALPADVERAAKQAYAALGAPRIAVRSSALDEDSARHSFAGQLSTFLNVETESEALRCLKECWASGFAERGLSYRFQNGLLGQAPIHVAVVFQEMVDSDKSGVLFTCDPRSGEGDRVVINAVYGIGEGLVSGQLDADTFVLEKRGGKKLSENLVRKETQFVRSPQGGTGLTEKPVEPALQEAPSLSAAELAALLDLGVRIERYYCFPQDIEWGIREGRLYVLQARPVTTTVAQQEGTLNIWDNSNIVESYGGITLPLTFTFAHYVYHSVYVQLCQILLVPRPEIARMDTFLRNMLGIFYGRVFYNILNWYKLTSILPGYKHNRSFMETMMGTQHQLDDEIAERVKLTYGTSLLARFRRFVSGLKFFYFHLTAQSMVDSFLAYFHKHYECYRKLDYEHMNASEIYGHFNAVEILLLNEWKAPIVNDYLTMVHFGVLKKLTEKWLARLGSLITNDLMCGDGNLESAEPTRELIRLCALVQSDPALTRLIEGTPAEDCHEALVGSPFKEFLRRIERYVDLYGHRCMSEMKLEQKDLHQDPTFLFSCLKNYLRAGSVDLGAYESKEQEIRQKAEKLMRENLGGWKLWVFLWSLKHARRAVRNRENTRFCRTRVYGIVRRMFYAMGKEFTQRGLLERPEDVFYLTLPELRGMFDAVLPCQDVASLVATRKKEYARYTDLEPASRFMTRGVVYWANNHFPEEKKTEGDLPPNCLKGIGCCPGVIEGTVKVILSPEDDMVLNGEILVTTRTDPGWIPLYPSISGLLVERGGLLSHSAIVAREMGLPTVVSIQGLTKRLKNGMRIRLDGQSGIVEILSDV